MNQDNDTVVTTEDTGQDRTADHGAHDGPHECEFCSPEPELIPAPWERAPGEGADEGAGGGQDADGSREVPLTEPITRR